MTHRDNHGHGVALQQHHLARSQLAERARGVLKTYVLPLLEALRRSAATVEASTCTTTPAVPHAE